MAVEHVARAALAAIATLVLLLVGPGAVAAAAPVLTVEAPVAGSSISSEAPSFSGKSSDGLDPITLHLYAGTATSGTPLQSPSVLLLPLGEWTAGAESLSDGQYTAVVEQAEGASEPAVSSVTFTVDTIKPVVSIESVSSPTKGSTPTLEGLAGTLPGDLASVTVTVYEGSSVGGTVAQTTVVPVKGGRWSDVAAHLADGTYTAEAVQGDEAGNIGEGVAVTFTVDTVAPVVTIEQPPAYSSEATPTLGGTAGILPGDRGNVLVTVYKGSSTGGAVEESTSAEVTGAKWSLTSANLADGTYTAQVTQQDEAGNIGVSAAVTFTVDTTAPVVTTDPVASPTKDPTPTLKGGAGELTGDQGIVKVMIYEGSLASGREVESVSVTPKAGEWSYTPPHLFDGTYTVQATQEDKAGNIGRSAAVTFTLDTQAPIVTLNAVPTPGNDATPTLTGGAGTMPLDLAEVDVTIYKGSSVKGEVLGTKSVGSLGSSWSYKTPHLPDGTYTARATQENKAGNIGASAPVTFLIDTTPPALTLTSPVSDAVLETAQPTFGGLAGVASGDSPTVKVRIYAGASTSTTPVQVLETTRSGTSWAIPATAVTLANGIYTVLAEQTDEARNKSTPTATFAVASPAPPSSASATPAPSPPAPPHASFQWFPSAPHVGEPVSLVSTSSDAGSTITGFDWALASTAPLTPGERVLTTSFATPGAHVVRLRVVDANGLASEISETIPVSSSPLTLMQPFPVVRIAGSAKGGSVDITLVTVQAPVGSRVSASCHGRGCPGRPQSFLARSRARGGGAGDVVVSLGRFERSLKAGAVLEIKVSKTGEIGKYTRLTVRRNKLPLRFDSCLDPVGAKPMACPS